MTNCVICSNPIVDGVHCLKCEEVAYHINFLNEEWDDTCKDIYSAMCKMLPKLQELYKIGSYPNPSYASDWLIEDFDIHVGFEARHYAFKEVNGVRVEYITERPFRLYFRRKGEENIFMQLYLNKKSTVGDILIMIKEVLQSTLCY